VSVSFGLEKRLFGYNSSYFVGAVIGGLIGVYLLSVLFRYALLGRSGTKVQQTLVVLLTGIVATGFFAFGEGADGFMTRITNPQNPAQSLAYALSTVIVGFLVWWRTDDTPPLADQTTSRSVVGRAVALVFVIPMILVGIGNIGGNIYNLAVNGPLPAVSAGLTRAEVRENMLTGDLASFWTLVDERAPADLDYIVERLVTNPELLETEGDARRFLEAEMVNYRISLATYGPALSDIQRKEIIESNSEILRLAEDQPTVCADLGMTGGQNVSSDQLLTFKSELNRALVIMVGHLLDAKDAAVAGSTVPKPPTEQDYLTLVRGLLDDGMTEDQLQAIFNQEASHPEFCAALIMFMDGVVAMDGMAGEAVRFEVTQGMLTAAPQ